MDLKNISKKTIQFILIVITVSFLSSIFGSANNLAGVSIITAFLIFKELGIGINRRTASVIILLAFPFIGIITHFMQSLMWLGFIANIITMIIILVFSGPSYHNKGYIPFVLTFIFLQGNPVQGADWYLRITELSLGGLLLSTVYFLKHKDDEEQMTLKEHINTLKINPQIMGFIMRMSIGIPFAILMGIALNTPKVMWISIVIMSLTQITKESMHNRIKNRVLASFIGVILFVCVIEMFIPTKLYSITLLILGFIYSFFDEYKYQQIITTMSVLTVSVAVLGSETTILARLSMLGFGIIIVAMLHEIQIIWQNSKNSFVA